MCIRDRVASAPSFPHGAIDPIPQLASLAQARGIGLHVDACLGGFVLPWAERLGYNCLLYTSPGSLPSHFILLLPRGASLARGHLSFYVLGTARRGNADC